MLCHLWLPDGHNFAELMLTNGFAHEYTYYQPNAYTDTFKAAQDLAIANQAGLWSSSTCAGDTTRPADAPVVAEQPSPHPEPAPGFRPAVPASTSAAPGYSGRYDPLGPDRDCNDFEIHAEAQAFFVAAGGPGSDRHRLDPDRDDVACETLP